MVKPLLRDDKDALKASTDMQERSKSVLERVQQNLQETEQVGVMTLDDLYAQRRKINGIDDQADRLHDQLDETDYLQSKLGSWFGGKKKKNTNNKNRKSEQNDDEVGTKEKPTDSSNPKKKGKWKLGRSSKKSAVDEDPTIPTSTSTFGSLDKEAALYKGEHQEELRALADGDKEIDDQMDVIGTQLDNILNMAQEIGTETKQHGQKMQSINSKMEEAEARQSKANKKTRRLLGFSTKTNKSGVVDATTASAVVKTIG